ncbi:MFS family permease [Rhodococcus sp. 27YEA15]|uniref:MFS transporter n=1 Tax=Rhodococcus sp. 27YEA15 TaxID=3156259 RepID=UPI003C7A2279
MTESADKGLLSAYRDIFSAPGSVAFSAAGFVARLPMAMIGIGIVTMISQLRGDYGLAGALAAVFALASAIIAPAVSRAVDRFGQRAVLPIAAVVSATAISALLLAVRFEAPTWLLFACVIPAGATPTIGAMIRARWVAIYVGRPQLRTAFAFESVVDELCFVAGPVISVGLSIGVFPEAGPLAGVVLLVTGTLLLISRRDTEPAIHARRPGRGRSVLGNPAMWIVVTVMVMLGTIFGVVDVGAIAFTADQGSPGSASLVLAIFAAASGSAGLIFGSRHPVMALRGQLMIASSAVALLSVPMLLAGNILGLAGAYVLAGATIAPTLIVATALVEQIVPPEKLTEGMTLTVTGLGVGVALGSALAGQLIDRYGVSAAYQLGVGAAVAASIVTACLFVKPSASTARPSSTD